MSAKEEFIEIFREHVHRDGAEALLDYLEQQERLFHRPRPQPGTTGPMPAACASTA